MPAINFMDGSQIGQTQSMLRWIGQSCYGRRGEVLYPNPMNPEACYEIDSMIEVSEGFIFPMILPYFEPTGVSDEKAKELAEGPFRKLLFKIDAQLKVN